MGKSRLLILGAIVSVTLTACGSSGRTSSPTTTTPSTATSATTGSPPTAGPLSASTTIPPGIAAEVIAPPNGYTISTASGVTNGPITAAAFDQNVGAYAAVAFSYKDGYDVTFDSATTSESIEVTLFRLGSAKDASAFERILMQNIGTAKLSPTRSTIGSIPGSVVQAGTKAGSDGFFLVDALAQKGADLMVVEYSNLVAPSGTPPVLASAASAQYARLN